MRRGPRNFATTIAVTAATMLLNFLAARVVVHRLALTDYGAWVLLSSFSSLTVLFDLGIGQGLVRLMAADRGRPDGDGMSLAGAALRAYLLLGLLAAVTVGLGGLAYARGQHLAVSPGSQLFVVDLLLAASALVALPGSVFTSILAAHERYDVLNAANIATTVATTGLTILVFLVHGTVLALAAVTVGVLVASVGIKAAIALRMVPGATGALVARRGLRPVLVLIPTSIGFFVQGLAVTMIWRLDAFVVATGVSVAAVTGYSLAQKVALAYLDLGTVGTFTLLPSIARVHAGGGVDQVRPAVVMMTRSAVLFTVPFTALLMLEARDILTIWVGPRFAGSAPVAVLLILVAGVSVIRNPSIVALQAFHSVRWLALMALAEGVLNLAFSIALVRVYGVFGVALGTAIPSIAFSVGAYLRTGSMVLRITLRDLFGTSSLRTLLTTCAASAVFVIPVSSTTLVSGLVHGALFVLLYAGTMAVITPRPQRAAARTAALDALRAAVRPEAI